MEKDVNSTRFVSNLTKNSIALILAGGRGSRLQDLTSHRAKPAVPFGGKFRIIDFPLSNCINSGIRRVGVVTQYKSHSLMRHIQRGWGFLRGEFNEYVDLLPASQQRDTEDWYKGTADAVYQNLNILRVSQAEFVGSSSKSREGNVPRLKEPPATSDCKEPNERLFWDDFIYS